MVRSRRQGPLVRRPGRVGEDGVLDGLPRRWPRHQPCRTPGGPVHTYKARYHDIVPNERIITTYEMYMDDTRTSVSVGTLELERRGTGTALRYTEQGAFLDGLDAVASREQGSRDLLDALGRALEPEDALPERVASAAR
jgi:hypothetical protein